MQKFKVFDVLKNSFDIFKKNVWFLVSSTFVYYVIYLLLTRSGRGMGSIILHMAASVVSFVFSIGMYKIGLKLLNGEIPKHEDFTPESIMFFRFIWMSVLVGFFVFVGFLFIIIPGIYIMVRLSMSTFILVDKKMSALESIKESWRITKGSSLKILGLMFVTFIIFVVSTIPFGLGLLLSTPFYYVLWAEVYRKLNKGSSEEITITPVSS